MKTPEQNAELLRQQVISKIHWGAREEEVTEWLQDKHGIAGDEADRLLADAYLARRKAVRHRAIIRLVCSIVGLVLVAAFFYIRFFSGVIWYGGQSIIATFLAVGLGGVGVTTFARSTRRLLSGEQHGSVD